MKVLIIGSTGWVGDQVLWNAVRAGFDCITINRSQFWLDDEFNRKLENVDAVINCAGYAGSPNVDACELPENRQSVHTANIEIPKRLAKFCKDIPFVHVSSGCLYQGQGRTGKLRERIDYVEKHFSLEDWQHDSWSERNAPNFRGSYYARTKIEGEQQLKDSNCWILRPRMFFGLGKHNKNFISKIIEYDKIVNAINSVTHIGEFCTSIIKCINQEPPFGIYNITHPIPVMTSQILDTLGYKKKYVTCHQFNEDMKAKGLAERSFTTLDSRKACQHNIGLSQDPMQIIQNYKHQ